VKVRHDEGVANRIVPKPWDRLSSRWKTVGNCWGNSLKFRCGTAPATLPTRP